MVHAFEPVESTFKRLAHNVDLNNLGPKIKVNQFGLSNKAQEVEFYLPAVSGSGAASMKELHADELNTRVMCELKTLDEYSEEESLDSVDLIKIDVEGAELLTIQGGINTIRGNTPIIFAELLRKWAKPYDYHPNDVLELLEDCGLSCWAIGKSGLRQIDEVTDKTVETNYLFASPEKKHHDVLEEIMNFSF